MKLSRWIWGLSALTLILPFQVGVPSAAASEGQSGLERLGGCIAGGGDGEILILMDRSGSLKTTDPDGGRIDAARYLVNQLAAFSDSTQSTVNVAIAGFDTSFEMLQTWTPVGGGGAETIGRVLESLRGAMDGRDTDYWTALQGARNALSTAGSEGANSCPAVVWFSDGQYDIEKRSGGVADEDLRPYAPKNKLASDADVADAVKSGSEDLCRDGGVADQVRSQNITSIAVGLNSKNKPDYSLLEGIATGASHCGSITEPVPGAFFLAENIDDLFLTFDRLASPGQAPSEQEAAVCANGPCAAGTHSFVLDSSIASVHALGTSNVDEAQVMLLPPGDKPITLDRSTEAVVVKAKGATVTYSWLSDRSVSIDLVRGGPAQWVGQWGLAFTGAQSEGGTSKSSLRLSGDIDPVWPEADTTELTVGSAPELTFALQHADGSVVAADGLSPKTTLDATLVMDGGSSVPILLAATSAAMTAPTPVSLDQVSPGLGVVRLSLAVTTQDAKNGDQLVPGTRLEPMIRDYPVRVHPPAEYPTVPASITFPATDEAISQTVDLPIDGEGCAWLAGSSVATTPEGVAGVELASSANSRETCVSDAIPITLSTTSTGNGRLSGDLTVMTVPSSASAEPIETPVMYSMEMQRPVDQSIRLLVLLGVFAVGLLVPLALLFGVKTMASTVSANVVRRASRRGRIDDHESFLEALDTIPDDEFIVVPVSGRPRELAVGDLLLKAKPGWNLTEPGFIVVEQGRAPAAGGPGGASQGALAKLPLAVEGTWIVSLDPVDPANGDVEITVLAGTHTNVPDLLAGARGQIGGVVRELRRQAADQSGKKRGGKKADDTTSSASGTGAEPPDSETTNVSDW